MWDWVKERIIFDESKIIAGACIGFIIGILIIYLLPAITTALATAAVAIGTAIGIIAFGILLGMGIGFCINALQMHSQNPDDPDLSLNNAESASEVENQWKMRKS